MSLMLAPMQTRVAAQDVTGAIPQPSEAPRPSFSEWLAGVRTEALSRGIREEIVDEALGGVEEPLPVVIERDRSQAEIVLSLDKYIARILTPKRIAAGREKFASEGPLLDQVGQQYGVAPRIIAAIWRIASNF